MRLAQICSEFQVSVVSAGSMSSSSSSEDFHEPGLDPEESVHMPATSQDENLMETTVLTYTVTDMLATILNDWSYETVLL